jgi:hypothetical protein
VFCVTENIFMKKGNDKFMEELKRMLKAIHMENKKILLLLCSEECKTMHEVEEVADEINNLYDELFYGKETNETTN